MDKSFKLKIDNYFNKELMEELEEKLKDESQLSVLFNVMGHLYKSSRSLNDYDNWEDVDNDNDNDLYHAICDDQRNLDDYFIKNKKNNHQANKKTISFKKELSESVVLKKNYELIKLRYCALFSFLDNLDISSDQSNYMSIDNIVNIKKEFDIIKNKDIKDIIRFLSKNNINKFFQNNRYVKEDLQELLINSFPQLRKYKRNLESINFKDIIGVLGSISLQKSLLNEMTSMNETIDKVLNEKFKDVCYKTFNFDIYAVRLFLTNNIKEKNSLNFESIADISIVDFKKYISLIEKTLNAEDENILSKENNIKKLFNYLVDNKQYDKATIMVEQCFKSKTRADFYYEIIDRKYKDNPLSDPLLIMSDDFNKINKNGYFSIDESLFLSKEQLNLYKSVQTEYVFCMIKKEYEKSDFEDLLEVEVIPSKTISLNINKLYFLLDKNIIKGNTDFIIKKIPNTITYKLNKDKGMIDLTFREKNIDNVDNKKLIMLMVDILNSIINNEDPLKTYREFQLSLNINNKDTFINRKKI